MRPACGRLGRDPLMSHLYDDAGPCPNIASLRSPLRILRGVKVTLPGALAGHK